MITTEECRTFFESAVHNWKTGHAIHPKTGQPLQRDSKSFKKILRSCDAHITCPILEGPLNLQYISCYIDSLLFVLCAIPNRYIYNFIIYKTLRLRNYLNQTNPIRITTICDKDIQKNFDAIQRIQEYLQYLTIRIRAGKIRDYTCRPFMRILKKYCSSSREKYAPFWEYQQDDPRQLLGFLIDIFQINNIRSIMTETIDVRSTSSQPWIHVSSRVFRKHGIVWYVPPTSISSERKIDLSRLLTIVHINKDKNSIFEGPESKRYRYQRVTLSFTEPPPVVVMNVDRGDIVRGRFWMTDITPNENIGKHKLFAIISHLSVTTNLSLTPGTSMAGGGHYVAYVVCQSIWYKYDDMNPVLLRIGSYNDLLKERSVRRRGILYFYTL